MIYEAWTHSRRQRRYREISNQIIEIITRQSQSRVDVTLTEAYAKMTSQQAEPEVKQSLQLNMQGLIDKTNSIMAKENAMRIRQWTEAILEQEERFGYEAGRTQ